jgi:signal transduction histidine kinase
MDVETLQKLCLHLNEFSLSRAIVDFDRKRFVAWNQRFLARTGYSEEEIKSIQPDKIVLESEGRFTNPQEGDNPSAEFVPVAVRTTTANAAEPGHLVRSRHNLGYLMLNEGSNVSGEFEQGRLVGKEQERMRIVRMFHDEISSGMLGAVFKIHQAQEKLNSVNSPEAETVSEASELLSDAIEKMSAVMDDEKKSSEAADQDSA